MKLRVAELVPNKRVEWACISTHPKTSPASAWTGTHVVFELTPRAESTRLDFRQTGYDERSQFLESNTRAWGQVLQNLKKVVESRRAA